MFGLIVRNALQRAELPFDVEHLELARSYANDNIQDLWSEVKADFRQVSANISVVAGTTEYFLPKDCDKVVLNTMRGPSTNPRNIIYKDPIEYYRFTRNYPTSTGTPNIFTNGKLIGYDAQLTAPSVIKIKSNLANYTTGTVQVFNGSVRLIGAGTSFTQNHIGLYVKVGTDTKYYKVASWVSSTELALDEVYRGQSASGASFKLGDIGTRVSVQGIVNGESDFEEVTLDGTSTQTTTKTFSSITGITKSDLTGGIVTATDTGGAITVASIAPSEYEVERQTIVIWRIPSANETWEYRYYRKHPQLRGDMDRLLIPTKFHQLVQKLTEADLRGWADKAIPPKLQKDIQDGEKQFKADANDSSLWVTIPQEEGLGFGLTDVNNRALDQDFVAL